MPTIKISSKVDQDVWNQLRELADESHQNIAGLLTDAIRDYLWRRRVRPGVLRLMDESLSANDGLGRLLGD